MTKIDALAVLYWAAGIATFGHAAAHHVPIDDGGAAAKALAGLFSGIFWPLYWSWEAWS